jgi:hypothetical protein
MRGTMSRNDQIRLGFFCAAMVTSGLYLAACTHDPIEPAPVFMNPISKTTNSTSPVATNRTPAPVLLSTSPPRAASAAAKPAARQAAATQQPGRAPTPSRHAAHTLKVATHSARPHTQKLATTYSAGKAASAAVSTRHAPENIPLDEPVTRSAGPEPTVTPPVWVAPSSAEAPHSQFRPPVP